jgi:alpha-tubulin suppressor-like RCC1 family protein
MAIIEVVNPSTSEKYLMSAGMNFDGLSGQGNDEAMSSEFKKLDYDHTTIQFKKVSLLTRHALAITEKGELYGWGCNENQRLGLSSSVVNSTKPVPIPFFNDPKRFKLLDVSCGADHSFVYVKEYDALGRGMLRTY